MKGISLGKCQLLQAQTFCGNVYTTCKKPNGIPGHSGRKGKQIKTRKGGKKILQRPRIRTMSANDIYMRC